LDLLPRGPLPVHAAAQVHAVDGGGRLEVPRHAGDDDVACHLGRGGGDDGRGGHGGHGARGGDLGGGRGGGLRGGGGGGGRGVGRGGRLGGGRCRRRTGRGFGRGSRARLRHEGVEAVRDVGGRRQADDVDLRRHGLGGGDE